MLSSWQSCRGRRQCCILIVVAAIVAAIFYLSFSPCGDSAQPATQCHRFSPIGGQEAPAKNFTIAQRRAPQCLRYSSSGSLALPVRNFTIVTAYLNIGAVQKGNVETIRGPEKYGSWMWPYAYVLNGVVAYFDDVRFADAFAGLRGRLPTKIVMVNRSELWAFSMLNATARIFAQPDYPRNYPKSTSPEYVAAMHAKTELTARTVRENPFGSSYFAWMDMGLYRELPRNATDEFTLNAPRCLCDNTVLFARVHPQRPDERSPQEVMRQGLDWVAGSFFIARTEAMLAYCADYQRHVQEFLQDGLANHDQSVIYAMYLPGMHPRPVVPLQAISTNREMRDDQFFFMAMQLRRLALGSQRAAEQHSPSLLFRRCSYEMYG